jgi:hypothetical protein
LELESQRNAWWKERKREWKIGRMPPRPQLLGYLCSCCYRTWLD